MTRPVRQIAGLAPAHAAGTWIVNISVGYQNNVEVSMSSATGQLGLHELLVTGLASLTAVYDGQKVF